MITKALKSQGVLLPWERSQNEYLKILIEISKISIKN